MSGIAGAIVNGIDSATYNPEAEKARKEAKEKAEKEKCMEMLWIYQN